MQLGAMTRKITYAGRWKCFKACAGNRRCPWKEGPHPVPTCGQFSAHGDRNLSGLSSPLGCTMTTENLVLASSVPSVMRRPHKILPVDCHCYGTEQNPLLSPSLGHPGGISQSPKTNSSRTQRCPCHSQALYSVTKGEPLTQSNSLDLGFSHMDASTTLLSHSAVRKPRQKQQTVSSQCVHTTMELLDLSASTIPAGPGQANVTKCPPVGQSCPFMSPKADWSFEDHSKLQNSVAPQKERSRGTRS